MLVYAVTIFLSAFLLFQVQPLIAKFILPWFGGSAAVWSAALLFFQLLLLAGYLYAHCLIRYLKPKQQLIVHLPLLVLSALSLPIIPSDAWKPEPGGAPTFQILALLAVTIGLPYMILSSTSPLLQAWYVRTHHGAIPYRLFALSNFGSMLALLSYPFLVEPNIALSNQAYIWSGGFGLFALVCAYAAWVSQDVVQAEMVAEPAPAALATSAATEAQLFAEHQATGAAESTLEGATADTAPVPSAAAQSAAAQSVDDKPPTTSMILFWIGLAACASALLLATTSHLTQNVAPIPLLWVVPLSLYLLSFILSFESDRIYQRWIFLPLGLVALAVFTRGITAYENNEDVVGRLIPMLCAALFIGCMICHGELAQRRPHPRYLTLYFLMVSVGGAVGGLFVAMLAPYAFPNYWEMPISVVVLAMLMAFSLWRDEEGNLRPLPIRASMLMVVVAFGVYLGRVEYRIDSDYELTARDFYGVVRVSEYQDPGYYPQRALIHGTINHGTQELFPGGERTASSYFGTTSGINRAIRAKGQNGPIRLGVIGLGAGVTAALAREGDTLHYYEINPNVFEIAKDWFDFWEACPADKEIYFGDGRLTLEGLPDENLDVLVMDAFTSDAVPVHMLTDEAFDIYLTHLNPGGLIMVNITNRYLDLAPVVAAAADRIGFTGVVVYDDGSSDPYYQPTSWIVLSDNAEFFNNPDFYGADVSRLEPREGFRGWTDDYSNIFEILQEY